MIERKEKFTPTKMTLFTCQVLETSCFKERVNRTLNFTNLKITFILFWVTWSFSHMIHVPEQVLSFFIPHLSLSCWNNSKNIYDLLTAQFKHRIQRLTLQKGRRISFLGMTVLEGQLYLENINMLSIAVNWKGFESRQANLSSLLSCLWPMLARIIECRQFSV